MKTFKKIMLAGFCGIIFGVFAVVTIGACIEVTGALGYSIVRESDEVIEPSVTITSEENEPIDAGLGEVDGEVPSTQLLDTHTTVVVGNDVTEVVDEVMPSIVSITNNMTYHYYSYTAQGEAKGSGIIIGQNDDELLIATNNHVVADNDELTVTFCNDGEATARVKGYDANMDLAVVAVSLEDIDSSTRNAIKVAVIGDSDNLRVGESVVAIGNALGYGQSVTVGVVSALNREMDMGSNGNTSFYIQTDAAINQGNSGGALLNMAGEVIGINSNKIGGDAVEGMGYAIPISAARPIIEDLMQKVTRYEVDEDKQGCIGISGSNISSQGAAYYGVPAGVYIENVFDGSGAEAAHLKKGDILYSFDGQVISSMEQLQKVLACYEEGETVEIVIYRNSATGYKARTTTITLGNKSDLN